MSNTPIERIKEGGVTASLFENTNSKTGQTYLTASISRSYKDEASGGWKRVNSYSQNDLGKLQSVLTQTQDRMQAYQQAQQPEKAPAQQAAPPAEQQATAMANAQPPVATGPAPTPSPSR